MICMDIELVHLMVVAMHFYRNGHKKISFKLKKVKIPSFFVFSFLFSSINVKTRKLIIHRGSTEVRYSFRQAVFHQVEKSYL